MDTQFSLGFMTGLFAALVFGLISRQILFAIGSVRAFFAPPVQAQTSAPTPGTMVSGCLRGLFILGFWAAVLAGGIMLVARSLL